MNFYLFGKFAPCIQLQWIVCYISERSVEHLKSLPCCDIYISETFSRSDSRYEKNIRNKLFHITNLIQDCILL